MASSKTNYQPFLSEESTTIEPQPDVVPVLADLTMAPNLPSDIAGGVEEKQFRKEGSCRQVYVRGSIQQVAEIDVMSQTFQIEIRVFLAWRPTEAEYRSFVEDPENFQPFYPQLDVLNHTPDLTIEPVLINKNSSCQILDDGMIHQKVLIQGNLGEKLELRNFPFDCQDLPFKLESHSSIDRLKWLPASKNVCAIQPYNMKLPEWSLEHVMAEFVTVDYGRFEVSRLYFRIKVRRKPGSYLKRIAAIMAVICFSTLLAFSMDPIGSLQDRLAHCMTILLTATAFQLVASSSLPQINYLTLMDKYVLFCFFYICVVSIVIALEGKFNASLRTDDICFWIAVAGLVVGHVVFVVWALLAIQEEDKKLVMTQEQLDAMDIEEDGLPPKLIASTDFEFNGAYFDRDISNEI